MLYGKIDGYIEEVHFLSIFYKVRFVISVCAFSRQSQS
mgnify:CR=1 FL=1